jgi:fibronectin-binding autotransporter adhesin
MSTFSGRQRSLRGPAPQRRTFCSSLYARSLRCERLEDRRLLAQLTVTTDQDIVDFNDGETSLREAIFAANIVPGADEIVFDFGHDGPATILLTQGELAIMDSLTITGPGAGLLTIDASGSDPTPDVNNRDGSRLFNIDDGTASNLDASITGMTLTGGDVLGDGGAINSLENLNLIDCVIVANHSAAGGGLYSYTLGGQVTVRQTKFVDNVASFGGGVKLYAYANSDIVFEDLEFVGNRAELGGGGAELGAGSSRIRVSRSTFSHNSVLGNGGGLAIFAGADSAISLQDSVVTQNQANFGGGVFMYATDLRTFPPGEAIMSQCTVSSNTARTSGGGVYALSNTSVESGQGGSIAIRHSTVTGNVVSATSTPLDAGGVSVREYGSKQVLMDHSIIAANTRGAAPSDIGSADPVAVSHSLIGTNVGTTLPEAPVGSPDANGNLIGGPTHGVIDPLLGPLANNGGPTMTHALLPGSPAINAGEVAAATGANGVPEFDQRGEPFERVFGGRIDIGAFEAQSLVVDTLADEVDGDYSAGDFSLREAIELANQIAGANTIEFSPALAGGTILLEHGELVIADSVEIVGLGADLLTVDAQQQSRIINVKGDTAAGPKLIDVSISGLTLTHGVAPTTGIATERNRGGGIRFMSSGELSLEEVVLSGNSVSGTNAAGGGLFAQSGLVTVAHSRITGNSATSSNGGPSSGGGIYSNRNVILTDSTVTGNTGTGVQVASAGISALRSNISDNVGQGLLAFQPGGGPIDITECIVNGNLRGGILAWYGPVTVTDSEVSNNGDPSTILSSGSGISSGRDLTVVRSTVSGNYADGGGGLWGGGNIVVTDSFITDNHNQSSDGLFGAGGGIFQPQNSALNPTMTITSTVISGNTSKGDGGGIFANGEALIVDSVISGNHADARGGGIFGTAESHLTIINGTIDNNTARGFRTAGAGIFSYGDVALHSSTLSNNNKDFLSQANYGGIVGRNVLLEHVTISGNGNGGVKGSSITAVHSTVTANKGTGLSANHVSLSHTIVAGNIFSNAFQRDVNFNSLTATYSLISAGADYLGPLADNGGPTKTHALLPGSPAINAGDPVARPGQNGFPEFDQRGAPFARFGNGLYIDIGAFESQPAGGALTGDFDGDADVDGRDFLIWQRGFGQTLVDPYFHGDATRDGDIDGNDLAVWQETYGEEQEMAELGLRMAESESANSQVFRGSQTPTIRHDFARTGNARLLSEASIPQSDLRNLPSETAVDRAFEHWIPLRRASIDYGDIVTHRHVKRRDLATVANSK